ncbi:hypothetical protein EYF80_057400 [Liparis tanakae]|uniref:Uncharacterized protein n=1 Tax=Liparis tanakae TaxID=230148 RepID=A0A4Z2EUG8_9TELE|nr:hypothetical protein EYF80_057400 [Liparis tanakae]
MTRGCGLRVFSQSVCFSSRAAQTSWREKQSEYVRFKVVEPPAHTDQTGPPLVALDHSLVDLPQQSVPVAPNVVFGRLQDKLHLLLAEGELKGGERLHLLFDLLCIYNNAPSPGVPLSSRVLRYTGYTWIVSVCEEEQRERHAELRFILWNQDPGVRRDTQKTLHFTGETLHFTGETLHFTGETLTGETLHFTGETLTGETLHFTGETLHFTGETLHFTGETLHFTGETLTGLKLSLCRDRIQSGHVIWE